MKILAGSALLAVGVLALSACTPTSDPTPDDSPTPTQPAGYAELIEPAWTVDVEPIGDPAAADGVVVSYFRDSSLPSGLGIGAWDAATGKELWKTSAVSGAAPGGIQLDAAIERSASDKAYVAFLDESKLVPSWDQLRVAELASGDISDVTNAVEPPTVASELATGPADGVVWANDRPGSCQDGIDVCFVGYRYDEDSREALRLDLDDLVLASDQQAGLPQGARWLSKTLADSGERAPEGNEELLRIVDGKTLWSRDYQEIFGKKSSTDYGWSWLELTDEGDPGLLIGQGQARGGQGTVAALDAETGETLWSIEGDLFCRATDVSADQVADVLPICRPKGFVVGGKAADGSVDALGVNVADGDVVWETPLGKGGENYYGDSGDDNLGFSGTAMVRAVTVDGETQLLDLQTGALDDVPEGAVLLCSDGREVYERPDLDADRSGRKVSTGSSSIPCTADRVATDAWAVSPAEVKSSGTDAGDGQVIVSGRNALVGYDLG